MPVEQNAAGSTPLLNAAAIFGAKDIAYEYVDVPEWGGQVRVRGLTADEWDKVEDKMVTVVGEKQNVSSAEFRANVAVLGCVDENGQRIFADHDARALGAKSAAAVSRLSAVITRLSKANEKAVKELEGNSDAAPSGDSSTS